MPKKTIFLYINIASAAFLGLCILTYLVYYPFFCDDAFISLQYAQRLVAGKGLTWSDAVQPVEGYTNFLWVMLSASLAYLSKITDYVVIARAIGVASLFSIFVGHCFYNIQNKQQNIANYFTSFLFAGTSSVFAVWMIGGLEQALLSAFFFFFLQKTKAFLQNTHSSNPFQIAILAALMYLCRPDAILLWIGFLLIVMGFPTFRKFKILLKLNIIPFFVILAHTAFRLYYYGDGFPNTAYIKVAFSIHRLLQGGKYSLIGLIGVFPYILIVIFGIYQCLIHFFQAKKIAPHTLLYPTLFLIWASYWLFMGGDIFPANRQWMPLIVLIMCMINDTWSEMYQTIFHTKKGIYGFTLACFGVNLGCQWLSPAYQNAYSETWEWEYAIHAMALNKVFGKSAPVMAVNAAGAEAFYSEFPCIDMLGLNDYVIARTAAKSKGQGFIGHEMANGLYVFQQKPDIISCETDTSESFQSVKQLLAIPTFIKEYQPVCFIVPDTSYLMQTQPLRWDFHSFQRKALYQNTKKVTWIKCYSPKVGIQYAHHTWKIPAYLCQDSSYQMAYFQDNATYVSSFQANKTYHLSHFILPKGNWHFFTKEHANLSYHLVGKSENIEIKEDISFSLNKTDTFHIYFSSPKTTLIQSIYLSQQNEIQTIR